MWADSKIRQNLHLTNQRHPLDGPYSGALSIKPYDDSLVQPSSVDLRLSSQIRVERSTGRYSLLPTIDCASVQPGYTEPITLDESGHVLEPGEFILGSTMETVALGSQVAARVEGKSSLGRIGLSVHITAGFIDPGFQGQVTLEIKNEMRNHRILIRPGMRIAQIAFFTVEGTVKATYGERGHYQGQQGPVESRYQMDLSATAVSA